MQTLAALARRNGDNHRLPALPGHGFGKRGGNAAVGYDEHLAVQVNKLSGALQRPPGKGDLVAARGKLTGMIMAKNLLLGS